MDNPIRLHWLDPRNPHQAFPPVHLAMRDPNGLLAIGGDLSLPRLMRAYSQGIFPWYNPDEPILWWCPDPRAAQAPEDLHISHSLRKTVRKQDYAVTMDQAFGEVLDACSCLARQDPRHLAGRGHEARLPRPARQRPLPFSGGVARRRTGRRPLWRGAGPRVLRRVDVLAGHRRFQDRLLLPVASSSGTGAST